MLKWSLSNVNVIETEMIYERITNGSAKKNLTLYEHT